MAGPSVTCTACGGSVHSHCVTRRLGQAVCNGCAQSLDYAYNHYRAQHMITQGGAAFGRLMASTGTVAGQALGAVATGAVGGTARLVTGMAAGAASACQGLRALDAPASSTSGAAPNAAPLQRPRQD